MPKHAVSVTLDIDNLRWLRGQAAALKARGLSDTLDRIVTAARLGGQVLTASVRSVAGTIEIAADDPSLGRADAYVRALYDQSIARRWAAPDAPPPAAPAAARRRPGRTAARRG